MHYPKSNTLSVYLFLLFFKLIIATSFAIAQTGTPPPSGRTNPTNPNNRATHYNKVGWYGFFGTIKLSSKFGLHAEYQWRRNNLVTDWQQGL